MKHFDEANDDPEEGGFSEFQSREFLEYMSLLVSSEPEIETILISNESTYPEEIPAE